MLSGLALSTWVARIPGVRDELQLSTAVVGLVLLCLSVGSVLGLMASTPLLAKIGAKRGMTLGIAAMAAGLVVVGLGTTVVAFTPLVCLALGVVGFGLGNTDVIMNVEAATVEKKIGKTIMPLMHACFSVGTVAGAGIGAAAIALDVPVLWHLLALAVVILACALVAVRSVPTLPELGDEPSDDSAVTDAVAPAAMRLPWRRRLAQSLSVWADLQLVLIGVVMLGMAFAEGSAGDWLPLAVVDGHHESNATGAITFGIFMAAMTVGRVVGGPVVDRFGRTAAIRVTAVLGVIGLITFILAPVQWLVVVGTVFWGFGASLGFPLGMSAAADDTKHAAARVSAVAMIGYCAFLVGPPLIGFLGQTFGLLNALFVVLVLMVAAGIAAPAVREASRSRSRA